MFYILDKQDHTNKEKTDFSPLDLFTVQSHHVYCVVYNIYMYVINYSPIKNT